MVFETLVNVLLAFVPRAVIAVMHTTIIRANMTAYSTAVGPSSRFRKVTTLSANLRMVGSFRQPGNPPAKEGGSEVLRPRLATGLPFSKTALRSESFIAKTIGHDWGSSCPV